MSIKAGDLIGYWSPGNGVQYPTRARTFGLTGTLQPVSEYKDGFVVRSRNFVLSSATSFTQADGITDADCTAAFAASTSGDTGGYLPASGFTLPDGYFYTTDTEGNRYIKSGVDSDGDGVADEGTGSGSGTDSTRSASVIDQATTWIKANPLITAAIVLAIVYVYMQSQQGGKKGRRKKILGLL